MSNLLTGLGVALAFVGIPLLILIGIPALVVFLSQEPEANNDNQKKHWFLALIFIALLVLILVFGAAVMGLGIMLGPLFFVVVPLYVFFSWHLIKFSYRKLIGKVS
nr:hypothetical protein [uncultured Deefgea sp.]